MKPCSKCGNEIPHVMEKYLTEREYPYQLDDALIFNIEGGYGMFYDSLFTEVPKIVLCYDCAVEFMHDNPWLKEIIGDETAEEAKAYWKEHYG